MNNPLQFSLPYPELVLTINDDRRKNIATQKHPDGFQRGRKGITGSNYVHTKVSIYSRLPYGTQDLNKTFINLPHPLFLLGLHQ
jgi:hypothetical protein